MDDEEESCINVDGGPPRKKLRLSKEQSRLLEESFRHNHTLNPVIKNILYIINKWSHPLFLIEVFIN